MKKEVKCNLAKFISKGKKHTSGQNEKPTLYRIQRDTGISMTTLVKYAGNHNTAFDKNIILKLCDYLKIGIEDLISIEKS